MLCTICQRNVALGKIAGPIRGQWCYCCLWRHAMGKMNMADKQQDNGPYTLYGRRTEHEAEVRVGSHLHLDPAKAEADDMVDSGVWQQASVRDRDDRTVHVGNVTGERDQKPNGFDPSPAA